MSNTGHMNSSLPTNNLFLDELVQDFDISLSGLCSGCDVNGSLIRDLNQVISTLGDGIKVENIDNEDNAQDSIDVNNHRKQLSQPESDKKGFTVKDRTNSISRQDKQLIKRLCFKGLSSEELSPISSVSSSLEKRDENSSDSQTSHSHSSSNNHQNPYGYSWRRFSKSDAPSVDAPKTGTVQVGQTIKVEAENRLFQYILGAATAAGVKLGSMTMTYLNQGQSYELRLKKMADIPNYDGKHLKSSLRLGFVEKRLQYRERDEMSNWCKLHSKDRILDVDFALSYGIFDVSLDSTNINCLSFLWDPNREASIFIKLNCISTEFTSKRHGGERGAPLRLIVNTFNNTQNIKLDSASCLVKVFKSKGADRKHKTDRDRIAKQKDSSLYFQPSYDCTLLTSFNEEDISLNTTKPLSLDIKPLSPSSVITSSQSTCESSRSCVQFNIATSSCQSPQSTIPSDETYSPSIIANNVLPLDATSGETLEWLNKNRFHKLTDILADYTSHDLRLLSREDLIQICGISDGIRLYNCIHSIRATTRLTLFITTDGKEHHAIYLKALTVDEFRERLIEALGINGINFKNLYIIGPNDIKIRLTDNVIQNMKNESVYNCSVVENVQEEYDLVLELAFSKN